MPYWMDTYFMDSNSPIMEQMIFFYDYSMMVIITVLLFLMLSLYNIIKNNILNLCLIEHQMLETVWSSLPVFMLFSLAVPSLRLLYLTEESFSPDMTIKIFGHQWYWSYEYSEFALEFDSFMENELKINTFRLIEVDNYLSIPVNAYVRLLISSADVIHSWTIQSLGIKTDAIPGRLNQINFISMRPGLYFGQCSEICGSNHSFMPISMKIMKMEDFILQMK